MYRLSFRQRRFFALPLILPLAAFLIAAAMPAQVRRLPQPSADNTGPPKKPGTVEGTVTDSVTKAPVKKAAVTLHNLRAQFSYATVTDASGHFRFDTVEPAPMYQVTASCQGFGPAASVQTVRVDEEQHVTGVSLSLPPLGVITGKVTDADGVPLRGVFVQAMRFNYQPVGKRLGTWGTATTDDRGEYRLYDLQPQRYYVRANRRQGVSRLPGRMHSDRPDDAWPAVFYSGTPDIAGATPTDVTAGAEVSGIDFQLHKVRAWHIRGLAIDAQTRQPVHGASVVAESCTSGLEGNIGTTSVALETDGSFEFAGLVPGSYCLVVNQRQMGQMSYARQVVTLADRDLDGVTLEVKGAFDVKGSVQVEGPPPDHLKDVRLALWCDSGFVNAVVKDGGSFEMRNVLPVVYQILPGMSPQGTYLKAIRVGDKDASNGSLDFTGGAAPVTLVFASDAGQLSVSVRNANGDPALRAMVTAVPTEPLGGRRDLAKVGFTGPDGTASLPGLAPGDYKVLAWEQSDANTLQAEEIQQAFESKAAAASIPPNGRESVRVTMITSQEFAEVQKKLR